MWLWQNSEDSTAPLTIDQSAQLSESG
uniref:Uncharacterized protein n=1 Tax=Anguilla anguilla TaxID=7936 RepID=A0A0E9WG80_ANGAN